MSDIDICLLNKTCVSCQGGMPPLEKEQKDSLLKQLGNSWSINEVGHLYKEIKLNDFMGAINLANKIAKVSEKEGHHPNLLISWGLCAIEIWTHKISDLTESDFILAAKIDGL